MVIDGKAIAGEIMARLKKLPKPETYLAAVLVGDDESSISFLAQKEKAARELGIDFRLSKFPGEITNDELRREVDGRVGRPDYACVGAGVLRRPDRPAHAR